MEKVNRSVFHFTNPALYKKFIQEISVEHFIRLLRQERKLSQEIFTGCRVVSQNYMLPIVQNKIEKTCKTCQNLRDILCLAWLEAKRSLVTIAFESSSLEIKAEAEAFSWFKELKKLQEKYGYEKIAEKLIGLMVWSDENPEDLKILISIISWGYEDQAKLEKCVDKVIEDCKQNPTFFHADILGKIAENQRFLEKLKKETKAYEEEKNSLVIKRNESVVLSEQEQGKIKDEISDLNKQDIELQSKIESLKSEIVKFENTLKDIHLERKQYEKKGKKIEQKSQYEQKRIDDELTSIESKINSVEKSMGGIIESIQQKEIVKKNIEVKIASLKNRRANISIIKGVGKTKPDRKETSIYQKSIPLVRDELRRINKLVGQIESLTRNSTGFVSTPSTLDLIELFLREDYEPPIEPPDRPQDQNDLFGYIHFWSFQALWNSNEWNDEAIAEYSFWRSKQLQREDPQLAAELAISGIFHAERTRKEDLDNHLLLQFLAATEGIDFIELENDDYEEAIFNLLKIILEKWERKFGMLNFLVQLAFISPDKINFMFDISDPRIRILLKRGLSRAFENFININEKDPSHEIVHLISSSIEQIDARMRSACNRWLIQDSVDAIAQNSRHDIMATLASFPNTGRMSKENILKEIQSQLSSPLSKAIRSGTPGAFEDLSKQCFSYSKQILQDKFWLSSFYIWPCAIHLAEEAMQANIQAKRLFRAALDVKTEKQFYPLNISDRSCSVELIITNDGNTEAKEIKALIMPSQDSEEADIQGGEPAFEVLRAENKIRHTIQISLKKPTNALHLEYILNWKDSSSMDERSHTGALKILSQREVDWDKAQNPYSLKSIKEPERLKGRSDVLNVLRRSRDSMDSYYITGQRRTGKSSVAQVYQKELNETRNHAAIYLWWGDLGTTKLAPICYSICYEIARKMKERTHEDNILCPAVNDFEGNENFVLKTFFKELHTRFPTWKFFIIIDDFDELPSSLYETEAGDRFFVLLRALLDQEFIALYLVGSEKLPEILKRQGERLNLIQRCEIDYIKDSNAIGKIITDPAQGILEYDIDAVEEIVKLSTGNPYYATLICSRLFNRMAQNRDYYVSKRDVEISTKQMIEEDSLSTYQHFWKDGVFLPGRLGERQQYHNAKVLIVLSRAQSAENGSVLKNEVLQRDDLHPLGREDAEYAINGLLERKVINEEEDRLSVRVPIFREWISGRGANAVERSFAEAGLDEVPLKITRGLSTRDLINIAQDLVYQEKEINEIQIADWISQFGGVSNQMLAYKLLKRLREEGYHNHSRMFQAYKETHKQIIVLEASESDFAPRTERRSVINLIISYLDPSGKSGYACQYAYRRVNRIHSKCAIAPDKLVGFLKNAKERVPIIFTDDIVGTGGTISKGFKRFVQEMEEQGLDIAEYNVYLAAITGTRIGVENVEKSTAGAIRIILWQDIGDRLQAFSESAEIFSDEEERLSANEMVMEIGKELEEHHPLGRDNGQLLIAFQHGCPNNTLPIFYKTGRTFRGKEWRPLFPR